MSLKLKRKNKRSMGHIAHLRKQFKSIKTYDYIITLIKRGKTHYLPFENGNVFIWTYLNPLHPKMLSAKYGWNWLSGSREKDFSILSMYYHYFAIISPRKLEFPSPKMLCDKLVEIGPVVLAKKIFKISLIFFWYFIIISRWKKVGPFI